MKAWRFVIAGFAFILAASLVMGQVDHPTPQNEDKPMMTPNPGAMGSGGGMMPGMMGMGMMRGGMMNPSMGATGSDRGMVPGMMMGMCAMRSGMMNPGTGMSGGSAGMMAIPRLFASRNQIRRSVAEIEGGVETLTESDVPRIARLIQTHVEGMTRLLDSGTPVRMWDPLFADLYAHRDEIEVVVTKTETGVRVVETGKTADAVKLVRAHADVVSRFLANGWNEMGLVHPSPLAER